MTLYSLRTFPDQGTRSPFSFPRHTSVVDGDLLKEKTKPSDQSQTRTTVRRVLLTTVVVYRETTYCDKAFKVFREPNDTFLKTIISVRQSLDTRLHQLMSDSSCTSGFPF